MWSGGAAFAGIEWDSYPESLPNARGMKAYYSVRLVGRGFKPMIWAVAERPLKSLV